MTDIRPPSNAEAERVVASAALCGGDVVDELREAVGPGDLLEAPYRAVVEAAFHLRDVGEMVTPELVMVRLRAAGRIDDLGRDPAGFLLDLLKTRDRGEYGYAARRVRDAALHRDLLHVALELARDAGDHVEPAEDLAARFEARLFGLTDGRPGGRRATPIAEAVRAACDRYDANHRGEREPGIPTGFSSLDLYVGGWMPGQLIVVGARPSVGKSQFAAMCALGACRAGVPTVFYSLEMNEGEVVDRMMAPTADVQLPRLRGVVRMTPDQAARIAAESEPAGIAGLPLWIDDREGLTPAKLVASARRHARRNKVRLFVVDYLQLLRPENPKDPRYIQVGAASRALKQLARETGAAVLCLAQLNREIESRGDPKPKMSDLRDSGEVEQDADVVLLLHRLDDDDQLAAHRVDVIVAKNRHGPRGDVGFNYVRQFARFEERTPVTG